MSSNNDRKREVSDGNNVTKEEDIQHIELSKGWYCEYVRNDRAGDSHLLRSADADAETSENSDQRKKNKNQHEHCGGITWSMYLTTRDGETVRSISKMKGSAPILLLLENNKSGFPNLESDTSLPKGSMLFIRKLQAQNLDPATFKRRESRIGSQFQASIPTCQGPFESTNGCLEPVKVFSPKRSEKRATGALQDSSTRSHSNGNVDKTVPKSAVVTTGTKFAAADVVSNIVERIVSDIIGGTSLRERKQDASAEAAAAPPRDGNPSSSSDRTSSINSRHRLVEFSKIISRYGKNFRKIHENWRHSESVSFCIAFYYRYFKMTDLYKSWKSRHSREKRSKRSRKRAEAPTTSSTVREPTDETHSRTSSVSSSRTTKRPRTSVSRVSSLPPPHTLIEVSQDNPKRGKSKERYEKYKAASTLQQYYDLGGSRADAKFDIARGYVKITDPNYVSPATVAAAMTAGDERATSATIVEIVESIVSRIVGDSPRQERKQDTPLANKKVTLPAVKTVARNAQDCLSYVGRRVRASNVEASQLVFGIVTSYDQGSESFAVRYRDGTTQSVSPTELRKLLCSESMTQKLQMEDRARIFVGTQVQKWFPGHGLYPGKVCSSRVADEDGTHVVYFKVAYADGDTEDMEVHDFIAVLRSNMQHTHDGVISETERRLLALFPSLCSVGEKTRSARTSGSGSGSRGSRKRGRERKENVSIANTADQNKKRKKKKTVGNGTEPKSSKKKKKRKRRANAYSLFMKENFKILRAENAGVDPKDLMKLLSELWKKTPLEERARYRAMANDLAKESNEDTKVASTVAAVAVVSSDATTARSAPETEGACTARNGEAAPIATGGASVDRPAPLAGKAHSMGPARPSCEQPGSVVVSE